jgi:hypothetical protein
MERSSECPPRLFACAAWLAAGLAASGCGPHVDVSVPVVTTLARGAVAANPLNLCNARPSPPADPFTGVVPPLPATTVVGAGFLPQVYDVTADVPRVVVPEVSLHGPIDLTLASSLVNYRDPSAIDLRLTNGLLPLGFYDVTVKNPEGTVGTLARGLQVIPPPFVQSVSPASICATQVQRVVLKGGVFSAAAPPAAAVGSSQLPAAAVLVDSPTQLTLILAANTLAAGSSSASIDLTDVDGCKLNPSASIAVGATCAP